MIINCNSIYMCKKQIGSLLAQLFWYELFTSNESELMRMLHQPKVLAELLGILWANQNARG